MYGETLEKLSNNISILQKNVEDFIETKRLAFPRLFFLNDTQFIDLLTKLRNQEDYDFYVAQLFPGASGFFFKKSIQDIEIPPQIINDVSVLDQDEINAPRSEIRNLKSIKNDIDVSVSKVLTQKAPKHFDYETEKIMFTEVLGMISQTKELFLFEKKVSITEKPELWLQKVELAMQETIGKSINYAVASFPKQSLDEWILDHPQQIILTTIHLILTHEVNELFEEMRRTGKAKRHHYDEDGEGEDMSEEEEQSQYYDDEATPKTPNTRDLIKHSRVSSMWSGKRSSQNSYRSSLRALKPQTNPKTSSIPESETIKKDMNLLPKYSQSIHASHNLQNASRPSSHKSNLNNSSVNNVELPDDKKKFAANMFGSDFDIEVMLQGDTEDRDDVMHTLQEKSFRGLFLRLQFWINQICKSLHGKGRERELDLPVVHRVVMKSIV